MLDRSLGRYCSQILIGALLAGLSWAGTALQADRHDAAVPGAAGDDMGHMSGHMYMTPIRPIEKGDAEKAKAVADRAKAAMAPYQDYRKALSDGYEIFLPDIPQPQYHFTKYEFGRQARAHFDPDKPTSLLYKKTADDGYKLVGAMYTDGRRMMTIRGTTIWIGPKCQE
jgi:hypothetical protein